MKYLGQHPRRCDCKYCVGNGDSKSVNKALKKKARQAEQKDLKKQIAVGSKDSTSDS